MTWGRAQAGNRASKPRRYSQWEENKPEQNPVDLCGVATPLLRFSPRPLLLMVALSISFTPNPEGALSTRHAKLHGGLTTSLSELVSV
jgi:hypothetical protein